MRGPDSRVSRPMRNVVGAEHPRRGATERDDQRSREIGVRVAAYTVGAEPQHGARRPYRFEYCGALRAFLRPYLRRSFSRASRARSPAFFSTGRVSGSSAIERAGDAEADRAGLAAHAAAVEGRVDVVDLFGLREPQRLLGDHLVREDREVRRERAPVHQDLAGAVAQPHAGDRFLAATGRLDQGLGQEPSFERGGHARHACARSACGQARESTGCCAWCGCVAPP